MIQFSQKQEHHIQIDTFIRPPLCIKSACCVHDTFIIQSSNTTNNKCYKFPHLKIPTDILKMLVYMSTNKQTKCKDEKNNLTKISYYLRLKWWIFPLSVETYSGRDSFYMFNKKNWARISSRSKILRAQKYNSLKWKKIGFEFFFCFVCLLASHKKRDTPNLKQ